MCEIALQIVLQQFIFSVFLFFQSINQYKEFSLYPGPKEHRRVAELKNEENSNWLKGVELIT